MCCSVSRVCSVLQYVGRSRSHTLRVEVNLTLVTGLQPSLEVWPVIVLLDVDICAATHCNCSSPIICRHFCCHTLQHTATHCSCSSSMICRHLRCSALQHTATYCNILQLQQSSYMQIFLLSHAATHCNILQHTAAVAV